MNAEQVIINFSRATCSQEKSITEPKFRLIENTKFLIKLNQIAAEEETVYLTLI